MATNPTRGAMRRCMARRIQHLSEDDAEKLLAELRYGSFEEPVCPRCASKDHHYRRKSRRQWRCRHAECGHTFSVTSGTRLDNHKLSFRQILRLLVHVEAAPKGVTLQSTSNAVCLVEKCSAQNLMKIREAVLENSDRSMLSGIIHMDGAHVCGKLRRSNRRAKVDADTVVSRHGTAAAKQRIRAINPKSKANLRRAKNKRVLIVLAEIDPRGGARRAIVANCCSENSEDVLALARRYVAPGSRVFTDENPAYNMLGGYFEHFVVNHSVEYSTPEGVSENIAEAFFSRIRRSQYGVHHGFRPRYMEFYGWEGAWRETNRRRTQSENVAELARWLLTPGYSTYWRGYHCGNRRRHRRRPRPEILMGSAEAPSQDARSRARKVPAEEGGPDSPAAP